MQTAALLWCEQYSCAAWFWYLQWQCDLWVHESHHTPAGTHAAYSALHVPAAATLQAPLAQLCVKLFWFLGFFASSWLQTAFGMTLEQSSITK